MTLENKNHRRKITMMSALTTMVLLSAIFTMTQFGESFAATELFSDDFDTDNWNATDSSSDVDTTAQVLNFTFSSPSINEKVVHDLGSGGVPDDNWTLKWKINFDSLSTPTGNQVFWLGILDKDETFSSTSNQDGIVMGFVHAIAGKGYDIREYTGSDVPNHKGSDASDFTDSFVTGTDYYCKLVRQNDTAYSGQCFTDSTFSTAFGNELTGTIPASTLTGLRYIAVMNANLPGNGDLTGTIDDIVLTTSTGTTCNGEDVTIEGTSGNDILNGTNGADVIAGLGGDDHIVGNGGDDIICGGDGIDHIRGGSGQDIIFGEDGSDLIMGDSGDDTLQGDNGNDTILGGSGDDIIEGNAGDDTLVGNSGDDNLDGKDGNDVCDVIDDEDNTVTSCEKQPSAP